MVHLIVNNRFIADYLLDDRAVLRCFVEAGYEGWAAYVFDMRYIDGRTNKPFLVFYESVDSAEEGIAAVDRVMPKLLDRHVLPRHKINWREVRF
jgi:hypothetical protein